MRGMVIFLLILIGISLFSFIAVSSSTNKEGAEQDSKNIEFKTFTSAVCEHKGDLVYCSDELFVDCNGKISKADEVRECNGFKLNSQEVTGFAVFDKGWKDLRNLN